MQAIILAIGDELVLGQTVDSNSAWLSRRLAMLGVQTYAHQTVADDQKAIELAIRWAAHNADVVIVSGGLGPTADDLTRQALADAMNQPLIVDAQALADIEAFFTRRNRTMSDNNRIQAYHPKDTSMMPNPRGTAPGIRAKLDRAVLYLTPGVPMEMKGMYEDAIEPELKELFANDNGVILTTSIHSFGQGESDVAQTLAPLMMRDRNPKVGTTVANNIVSIRIRSEFPTREEAQAQLNTTARDVEARMGPLVFGRDDDTLQQCVVKLLKKAGQTVATAESCTGGMISQMLTDVAGSSDVYVGGWVTYANAMKMRELDVGETILNQHGAVSESVVRALAEHAVKKAATDWSIAVSGIAGPGGGTADKPVGTVYVALCRCANETLTTTVYHAIVPGNREMVRDRTARLALQLLRLQICNLPDDRVTWARRC